MIKTHNHLLQRSFLYLALPLLTFALLAAKPAPAASNVTTTVTAVGKKELPPPIKKEDVQVYQGKERIQVADWKHATTLYMAVLIDDSLDTSFGSQMSDVKNFIMAQPQDTSIAVAYSRNGTAMIAQDFTNNHELAAKSIRLPLGAFAGAFSSPYLALQDWMKRWPSTGDRRSIVMISSGIDYFRGGFDPLDPDLDSTIERAQKENINIWTIFYPDSGHFGGRYFLVFNAQANISRLSEETGAETYYLGENTPVTLKPYFDEITEHLGNQYLLTFQATGGGKKGKFEKVRVVTEIPNVGFLVPSEVFLPPSR